jgi:hypothetical protein
LETEVMDNTNHNRRLNRDQNRVMLLIDADNVSADVIAQAFERVMAEQRAIHVRRAYCTAELAAKNLKLFKSLSIRPIVNVLVIRLREKGCRVEGIGQEGKTADDSKLVYDRFVDIEHRRASATTRRVASVDEPVRKAAPRGRARAMAVEPVAPIAVQATASATTTAPQRQARQPRAPREAARENARSRPVVAAPVAPAMQPPAPRLAALPDDLARIMSVLPELRSGAPLQLGVAAERLRSEGLLAKSAPSTKLFKKYPDLFVLTPERAPNKVQYRGTANS